MMKRILFSFFAIIMFITELAQADENYAQFATALRGYDAVAYHTENKPIKGDSNYAVHYEGLTYLFVSKSNAKKFKADSKKYTPAYNGYCAYGVTVGKKLSIDPEAFKVVDGKLYMNFNKSVQKRWSRNISGNIAKANKKWPKISNIHPDKL